MQQQQQQQQFINQILSIEWVEPSRLGSLMSIETFLFLADFKIM